jgi:hypothetical protein
MDFHLGITTASAKDSDGIIVLFRFVSALRKSGETENPAAHTWCRFADPFSVGICPGIRAVPYRLSSDIRAVPGLFCRGTGAIALCISLDIPSGTSSDLLYYYHGLPAAPMRPDSQ